VSKNLTAQLESLRPDVEREAQPLFSPAYIRYAMYLLLGIYVVNFLDRQVVNILAEPIKREFGLADWQLGLMSGFAFSVFFTTLGFPIARLAERKNRAAIIGVSVAVWSGLTALCGMAQTFAQLVALRLGVGVGEAGCAPPSHALIADLVPKERRASALAFYAMGVPIGSLLGAVLGGLIAGAWGWRAAFLVVGMPGLLFSMLAFTTLREPRRRLHQQAARAAADAASLGDAMRYLSGRRSFWLLTLGAAIQTCTSLGSTAFIPSFFLRNHSTEIVTLSSSLGALLGVRLKSIAFLGLALGLANGIPAAAGAWAGGLLADRLAVRDARAIMIAPTIASVLTVPVALVAFSVDPAGLSLCFLAINFFLGSLWVGPVFSCGQSLVPPQMRATAAATLLFTINLIGLGLGPLAVGVTSDLFNKALGLGPAQGVRWALMSCVVLAMPAAVLFWRARRSIREELVS
jgi:MFS family permease